MKIEKRVSDMISYFSKLERVNTNYLCKFKNIAKVKKM